MDSRRFVLVLGGTVLLAGAVYACGGKIDTDALESSSPKSSANDDDDVSTGSGKKKRQPAPPPDLPTSSPPSPPSPVVCEYAGGSSSGGGDESVYKCESISFYECGARKTDVSCHCASTNGVWEKGTCSCNGETFAYDCTLGCQPSREVYARCNVPGPGFGGTSGSSSSGG